MSSFFAHFEALVDPWVERKRRHQFSAILFITMAAVWSGCDDWNEMERYGETKEAWLRQYLELPAGIPGTFNRVFSLLGAGSKANGLLLAAVKVEAKTNCD